MADQTGFSMYFDGHWKSIAKGDNGEVLKLVAGIPTWSTASGGGALNDLSDVTITTVATGEVVVYTGAGWENQTLVEAGIADASHNHSGVYEPVDGTILRQVDVDDTPVNGVTSAPVSSNWAYDHENGSDPHSVYKLESELGAGATATQMNHVNNASVDLSSVVSQLNQLLSELQSSGYMA
jgi:hypothetical protein